MAKKGPEINWEHPSQQPVLKWLASNYDKFTYKELCDFTGLKMAQLRYAIQQLLGLRKTVNLGQFQYVQIENEQFYVSFRRRTKGSLEGSWFIKSEKGNKMELLSHYNWRMAGRGEVPKKYMLRFIDSSDLYNPDCCRVENLELVSYADHMRMNRKDNKAPSELAKSRKEYQKRRRELKRRKLAEQGIVVKKGRPSFTTPEQKEAARQRRLQTNKEWRERNREYVREYYKNKAAEQRAAEGPKKLGRPRRVPTPEELQQQQERIREKERQKRELQQLRIARRQADMAPGRKNRSQKFQPKLETKRVDYSQMKLVQVDKRTSIYVPKDQDTREAIEMYHQKRAAAV